MRPTPTISFESCVPAPAFVNRFGGRLARFVEICCDHHDILTFDSPRLISTPRAVAGPNLRPSWRGRASKRWGSRLGRIAWSSQRWGYRQSGDNPPETAEPP